MRKEVDRSIISTPEIRQNLFKLLSLLEETELAVQYHHHGKIFILKAYKTGKPYKQSRKIRTKINPLTISHSGCEKCGGLMISGLCVNSTCPLSKPVVTTTSVE